MAQQNVTTETHAAPSPTPQQSDPTPRRSMRPVWLTFGIFALMLTTSGATAAVTAYLLQADREMAMQQLEEQASPVDGAAVVEKVADSVVSISTESIALDFFGRQVRAEGAGSGFIVTDDGYIVTNNHVVEGARSVSVLTNDGQQFEARVVATEPDTDLALLKAETDVDLKPVVIGNSDDIEVGEEVYAVGNALGQYPNSVTKGIVSGLGRPITAASSGLRGNLQEFENLIQTDAAINAGNSGGPLVNAQAEVIGINTAVAGAAQNIGFSVPISQAQALIERAER